jgi:hypothetical protein
VRATIPALGAAVVIAAAVAWWPLPPADDADATPAAAPATAAVVDAAGVSASPATAYVGFAAEDAAPAGATAPPKPGPPVLVGLIGDGGQRVAYILEDGQTARGRLGDKVGRWRLTGIGPRSVTLTAGRKSLALALYGPRPQPPPPPQLSPLTDGQPAAAPPPGPPAPSPHALEPASAPEPRAASGPHPRYWVGPPGSAPPGFIILKPGERPPN